MWNVEIKKKAAKNLTKLPLQVRELFVALQLDLANDGPIQVSWPNYSKLNSTDIVI